MKISKKVQAQAEQELFNKRSEAAKKAWRTIKKRQKAEARTKAK